MLAFFLTIACLLSVTCGQQLCSAVNTAVCPAGASQRQCYTSTLGFIPIGTSTWAYISMVVTNPGRINGGFAVSDQTVTINGQTFTLPNAGVTVSGTGSATVNFGSGQFTNTVGTNCADIFVTGLAIKPLSSLPAGSTFTWCALFESQTSQTNNITWNIGVAAYSDMGTGAPGTLGILPSSNCSTNPNGYPAGTPVTYVANQVLGGTSPSNTDEFFSGPTGLRTPDSTALVCYCPLTNAPTVAPTKAPTNAPTIAPTAAPSNAPTIAPTNAPTVAPTVAPTKVPTTAPTSAPTNVPTTAPTTAPTNAPTTAPTNAPTDAPTSAPTNAPTPPTEAPTTAPTNAPTSAPTKAPTNAPTSAPTNAPTPPTEAPTTAPTNAPTTAPTKAPTNAPTVAPTKVPTTAPTSAPTKAPTTAPTKAPTNAPTTAPTKAPTNAPTSAPTNAPTPPTEAPTKAPTNAPTTAPTKAPTNAPTVAPTKAPTTAPTSAPTVAPTPPTVAPTTAPTNAPTTAPTKAPTVAPTSGPTSAPTPPTEAPTAAPTNAPTTAPTNAPTDAPTAAPTKAPTTAPTAAPTNAPTTAPTKAPTNAPTVAPTKAPTTAPTSAPTNVPTDAPTSAPTNAPTTAPTNAPTEAPTSAPTNAPTPPTVAPTTAPTNAPTNAPTTAPTNAPSRAPTVAPTPPTVAPTSAPTNAPTNAPTTAPTQAPTSAPTSAPTESPTAAPTAPTVRPTRAPTVPTNAPVTKAPTTEAPTAPVDRCTRIFTAHFTLTYDAMTNGYVNGIMVYDYYQKVLAFYYTNQTYQEIYTFNSRYGVGDTTGQSVYRISANGTCAPCARYQNNWAFPVLWNLTGVDNPYPTTTDANGCTNYTTPSTNNNWASYYGIKADGTLCYIGNQGRLFTLDSIKYCDTYNPQYTTPPEGCACVTPQDIVFSLDRSTSIFTRDTYIYRDFIAQFVDAYTFDPAMPATSMQLAITQWGSISDPTTGQFPVGRFGSIPFTMDPYNIAAAIANIGCVGTPCNFCNGNDNSSQCVFPTSFQTCTSCGLYSAGTRFTDLQYFRRRNAATQVIIVITDGNTNTLNSSWGGGGQRCCGDGDPTTGALVPGVVPNCDDGNWNAYPPLGCYTDVNAVKQQVQGMVPGVQIFAIGIGAAVKLDTLNVIASSPANVFAAPDWVTFLSQLQSIVTLTCVEPDPIKSCGTGSAACGFCNCGTTLLPDGIIYPNRCDSVAVVVQGQCFSTVPTTLNCTAPSCMVARCIPSLNNGTGDCVYDPRECNVVDQCYKPGCVNNACIPKLVCDVNVSACNCTPPVPTNETDPCFNTTAGLGCGPNGTCDTNTLRCNCSNNYTGIVCQFPPGTSECEVDAECDNSDACSTFYCDNTTGEANKCVYTPISCDDNNACSENICDFRTGCTYIFKSCNDNDGCTDDTCDNVTGLCNNTDRTPLCNYLIDICTNAYCDKTAPDDDQCFPSSVLCPRENNCSLVFCTLNDTINGIENYSGCYNRSLDCAGGFFGIIAGIAGGVIAGIVVAACLTAAACASGSAYAVSSNYGHHDAGSVRNNPLFKPPGKGADVNLGA